MSDKTPEYLLWLGFETTGLDTATCHILEAAVVLTTEQIEEVAGGEWLITYREPMPGTVTEMHIKSGLIAALNDAIADDDWFTLYEAEIQILDLLGRELPIGTVVTLAGSGIGTYDLPIIRRLMPDLAKRLTYHVHDVGVMRRAYFRAVGAHLTPRTEPAHRAMADVQQALTEGRAFADLFRTSHRQEATAPSVTISREPTPFEIIHAALHAKCGICGRERENHHHGVHANHGPHDWQPEESNA